MSDPADATTPPAAPAAVPPPAAWAAPGAPPFGTPTAPPASGYALPVGYAPPAGYGAGGQVSPGTAPGFGGSTSAPARPKGRGLGIVALVVALIATVGAALAVAGAAFDIGLGTGREIAMQPIGGDFDWGLLTPVREPVLLAEVAFWVGTALGVWALVQGVIAIVKDRGRAFAIAAVIVAALGPVVFFVVLQAFLAAGYTAGSSIGG